MKPRQQGQGDHAAPAGDKVSLASPANTPKRRRSRRKGNLTPRAQKEHTSDVKPRRLFPEASKSGSKRAAMKDEPGDDNDIDDEDDDLFQDGFQQDSEALQLSSRKKPRKVAAPPEPESSDDGVLSSKPDEEEMEESPGDPLPHSEAKSPRPSRDTLLKDPASKLEPDLLKLLVEGMASQLVCMCPAFQFGQ